MTQPDRYKELTHGNRHRPAFGALLLAVVAILTALGFARVPAAARVAEAMPPQVTVTVHDGMRTATFLETIDDAALRAAIPDLIARGVEAVVLRKAPIRDVQPLANMATLRSLNLSGTQVRDLGPLAGLTELRTLNLQFIPASNFAPLTGLINLRVLNADGTELQDLSPLASMTGLRDLSLSVTKVRSLSPLAALRGLESLNINSTRVSDLRPLAGLDALRSVSLNGTSVDDLQPLAGAISMRRIDAGGTNVSDVRPLAKMRSLQFLNLEGTKVADVSALAGLAELRTLALAGSLVAVPPPPKTGAVAEPRVTRPASEAADPVLYWIDQTNRSIQAVSASPFHASRALALESIAVLDTIRSINGAPAFLVRLPAPRGGPAAAAISGAAHAVLTRAFPERRAELDAALASILTGTPNDTGRENAVAFGKAVGDSVFAARENDTGAQRQPSFVRGAGGTPGRWTPTPPDYLAPAETSWATLRPFALISQNQFRPPGPPPVDSAAFREAKASVQALGAKRSTARTDEQTQIALFWADGQGTFTPPGHWNAIAAAMIGPLRRGVTTEAEVFRELNIALADTAIAIADAKYTYGMWRPVTAIRAGDTIDRPVPDWTPLIETPNHPSYVSGHAAFSAAAATVLSAWFGTQAFESSSAVPGGGPRNFTSLQHAADEAARSRLYGGIHFAFDNTDGLALGRSVGGWAMTAFRRTVEERGPTIMLDPPVVAGGAPASAVTGCALNNVAPLTALTVQVQDGVAFSVPVDHRGTFAIPATALSPPGKHLITLSATSTTGRTGVLRMEVETNKSGDTVGPPAVVH